MNSKIIENKLKIRDAEVTMQHMLDNSKADSGGERDLNFVKHLVESELLLFKEAFLKRTLLDKDEEFYKDNYKKMNYESDRHFLCRSIIQEELKKMDIATMTGMNVGNMNILRSNSSYDIVTSDFTVIMDIGYTPARNIFRGLTDASVHMYLISTCFDDYMDDILFSLLIRANDESFFKEVNDFEKEMVHMKI